MMPATFTAACARVIDVLADVTGVTCYEWTPTQTSAGPVASIDDDGAQSSPSEWLIPLNVYIPASVPDVIGAQLERRRLIDAFEAAFDAAGVYAVWSNGRLTDHDVLITSWVVTIFPDPV